MKKLYIVLLLCVSQLAGNSQTPPDTALSACVRPLFDYLLHSSRLNVTRQQNVTVRSIVQDAIAAGFAVDTVSCPSLQANMDKQYYTQTPDAVRFNGYIIAPTDSVYIARLGALQLSFSSVGSGFEHKLTSFFAKTLTAANKIDYTTTAPVTQYYQFKLRHFRTADFMDWYVNYTDTNGIEVSKWYKPVDTLIQFYATKVNLVQKADTIHKVYVTPQYSLDTIADPSYLVNQRTYFRRTIAILQIADMGPRPQSGAPIDVLVQQNPSNGPFRLVVRSTSDQPVVVRLLGQDGRPVEMKQVASGTQVMIGNNLRSGMYYAEIIQGKQRKTVKLMRL